MYDLATEVAGAGIEPFDDIDVLLILAFAEMNALVVMDPDDARAIAAAVGAGVPGDDGSGAPPLGATASPGVPDAPGSRPAGTDPPAAPDAGDAVVASIRGALAARDWERARARFVGLETPEQREWVVRHLGGSELTDGIEAWVAAVPDDADGYLVRGANAVIDAHLRTDDRAFVDELRFAEQNLWWAVELAFDDPVALTPLIRSGGALSIPREELLLRFGESTRRHPGLAGAHLEMVVALARTGTVDDLYRFVASVGGSIPDGSSLHAMVALAHLLAAEHGASGDGPRLSVEARADVDIACDMSVGSRAWTAGPGTVEAVNILAAALARGGEPVRAAQLLETVGGVRTRLPWALLADGAELYGSVAGARPRP